MRLHCVTLVLFLFQVTRSEKINSKCKSLSLKSLNEKNLKEHLDTSNIEDIISRSKKGDTMTLYEASDIAYMKFKFKEMFPNLTKGLHIVPNGVPERRTVERSPPFLFGYNPRKYIFWRKLLQSHYEMAKASDGLGTFTGRPEVEATTENQIDTSKLNQLLHWPGILKNHNFIKKEKENIAPDIQKMQVEDNSEANISEQLNPLSSSPNNKKKQYFFRARKHLIKRHIGNLEEGSNANQESDDYTKEKESQHDREIASLMRNHDPLIKENVLSDIDENPVEERNTEIPISKQLNLQSSRQGHRSIKHIFRTRMYLSKRHSDNTGEDTNESEESKDNTEEESRHHNRETEEDDGGTDEDNDETEEITYECENENCGERESVDSYKKTKILRLKGRKLRKTCPESGYFPDLKSCRIFYNCAGNKVTFYKCKKKYFLYSPSLISCIPGNVNNCKNFDCSRKQFAPFKRDPQIYATCHRNKPKQIHKCPLGYFFNEEEQSCWELKKDKLIGISFIPNSNMKTPAAFTVPSEGSDPHLNVFSLTNGIGKRIVTSSDFSKGPRFSKGKNATPKLNTNLATIRPQDFTFTERSQYRPLSQVTTANYAHGTLYNPDFTVINQPASSEYLSYEKSKTRPIKNDDKFISIVEPNAMNTKTFIHTDASETSISHQNENFSFQQTLAGSDIPLKDLTYLTESPLISEENPQKDVQTSNFPSTKKEILNSTSDSEFLSFIPEEDSNLSNEMNGTRLITERAEISTVQNMTFSYVKSSDSELPYSSNPNQEIKKKYVSATPNYYQDPSALPLLSTLHNQVSERAKNTNNFVPFEYDMFDKQVTASFGSKHSDIINATNDQIFPTSNIKQSLSTGSYPSILETIAEEPSESTYLDNNRTKGKDNSRISSEGFIESGNTQDSLIRPSTNAGRFEITKNIFINNDDVTHPSQEHITNFDRIEVDKNAPSVYFQINPSTEGVLFDSSNSISTPHINNTKIAPTTFEYGKESTENKSSNYGTNKQSSSDTIATNSFNENIPETLLVSEPSDNYTSIELTPDPSSLSGSQNSPERNISEISSFQTPSVFNNFTFDNNAIENTDLYKSPLDTTKPTNIFTFSPPIIKVTVPLKNYTEKKYEFDNSELLSASPKKSEAEINNEQMTNRNTVRDYSQTDAPLSKETRSSQTIDPLLSRDSTSLSQNEFSDNYSSKSMPSFSNFDSTIFNTSMEDSLTPSLKLSRDFRITDTLTDIFSIKNSKENDSTISMELTTSPSFVVSSINNSISLSSIRPSSTTANSREKSKNLSTAQNPNSQPSTDSLHSFYFRNDSDAQKEFAIQPNKIIFYNSTNNETYISNTKPEELGNNNNYSSYDPKTLSNNDGNGSDKQGFSARTQSTNSKLDDSPNYTPYSSNEVNAISSKIVKSTPLENNTTFPSRSYSQTIDKFYKSTLNITRSLSSNYESSTPFSVNDVPIFINSTSYISKNIESRKIYGGEIDDFSSKSTDTQTTPGSLYPRTTGYGYLPGTSALLLTTSNDIVLGSKGDRPITTVPVAFNQNISTLDQPKTNVTFKNYTGSPNLSGKLFSDLSFQQEPNKHLTTLSSNSSAFTTIIPYSTHKKSSAEDMTTTVPRLLSFNNTTFSKQKPVSNIKESSNEKRPFDQTHFNSLTVQRNVIETNDLNKFSSGQSISSELPSISKQQNVTKSPHEENPIKSSSEESIQRSVATTFEYSTSDASGYDSSSLVTKLPNILASSPSIDIAVQSASSYTFSEHSKSITESTIENFTQNSTESRINQNVHASFEYSSYNKSLYDYIYTPMPSPSPELYYTLAINAYQSPEALSIRNNDIATNSSQFEYTNMRSTEPSIKQNVSTTLRYLSYLSHNVSSYNSIKLTTPLPDTPTIPNRIPPSSTLAVSGTYSSTPSSESYNTLGTSTQQTLETSSTIKDTSALNSSQFEYTNMGSTEPSIKQNVSTTLPYSSHNVSSYNSIKLTTPLPDTSTIPNRIPPSSTLAVSGTHSSTPSSDSYNTLGTSTQQTLETSSIIKDTSALNSSQFEYTDMRSTEPSIKQNVSTTLPYSSHNVSSDDPIKLTTPLPDTSTIPNRIPPSSTLAVSGTHSSTPSSDSYNTLGTSTQQTLETSSIIKDTSALNSSQFEYTDMRSTEPSIKQNVSTTLPYSSHNVSSDDPIKLTTPLPDSSTIPNRIPASSTLAVSGTYSSTPSSESYNTLGTSTQQTIETSSTIKDTSSLNSSQFEYKDMGSTEPTIKQNISTTLPYSSHNVSSDDPIKLTTPLPDTSTIPNRIPPSSTLAVSGTHSSTPSSDSYNTLGTSTQQTLETSSIIKDTSALNSSQFEYTDMRSTEPSIKQNVSTTLPYSSHNVSSDDPIKLTTPLPDTSTIPNRIPPSSTLAVSGTYSSTPSSESYNTLGTSSQHTLETSSIIKDTSALNSSQFEYTDMRSTEPSIKQNVSTTLQYSSHNVSSDDPIKLTTPLPDSSTIPNRIPPSSTLAVSGTYSSTPSSESYSTLGTTTKQSLETSSIIKDTSALNSSQFEYTDMRSTEPSIKQNVSITLPYSSHNVSSDDPINHTTPLPDTSTIPNRIPPSSTLAVSGTYSSTPSSESYNTLGTSTQHTLETSSIIKDTSALNSSQFEYTDMGSTEPTIKQNISTTLPYSSHNVSSDDPITLTTPLPDTSTIPNRIPPSSTLAVSGTYSSTPSSESYNTLGTSTQQRLETSSIIKDTSALNSSQFEYTDMRSTEPSIKQNVSTTLPYSSHNVSSDDPIKLTTPLPDSSTIPNRIPASSTLAVSSTYSSTPSSESYSTLGTTTKQSLETSSIIKDTSALNSSQFEYTDMRSTESSIKQNVSITLPNSSHNVSSYDPIKSTTPLPDTSTIPNRIPPSSTLAVSSTYSSTPSSESYNTLGTSTQQTIETSSTIKDTSSLNSSQFEYKDMGSTEPTIKQNISTTLPYSSHNVSSDDPIKLTTPLPDTSTIPNRIPPSSTLAVSGTHSSTPSSDSYNTLGTSTQQTLETSSIIKDTSALNSSQFEYTDMRSTEPSIKQNVSTTLPYSSQNVSSDDPIKLTTPLPDSSTIPNRIPASSTLAVSGTYSSTPSSESYSTLGTTTKQSLETSSIIKDTSALNSSQFEYTDMRSTEPSIKQNVSITLPYSSHNVSSDDPINLTTLLPDTSTIPNRIPPSSTLAVSGTYSSTPSSESYNTLGTSTQQRLETSSTIKDTSSLNSSQFEYKDMGSTEPTIKQNISTTLPYSSHNVSSDDPIKLTTPLPDTSTIPNRIPPSSTLAVSGTYSSTPSSESYNTLGTSTQQTLETSSIIKDTSALNSSQFEYTDMRSTEPSIKQNVSTTLPYSSHNVSSDDPIKLTTPLPDTSTIPNRIPPSSTLAVSGTYSSTPSSESYNTLGTSSQHTLETSSIIKDTSALNSSQFEYTDMRSTEPSIKQNVSTTLQYSSHNVSSDDPIKLTTPLPDSSTIPNRIPPSSTLAVSGTYSSTPSSESYSTLGTTTKQSLETSSIIKDTSALNSSQFEYTDMRSTEPSIKQNVSITLPYSSHNVSSDDPINHTTPLPDTSTIPNRIPPSSTLAVSGTYSSTPSSESYNTLGTSTQHTLETSSIIKDTSALNSSQFEYTDMRSTEPSIKQNVSTTLPYSSHNVSSDDPIKLTTPLPDSSTIPNRIPPSSTLAVSGTYSSTPSSESYSTLGTTTKQSRETSSIIKDTSGLNSSQFEYTDMRSTEPSIKQKISTTLPYSSHNVSSYDPIKPTTPLPDTSTIPNRIPPSSTLAVRGTYSSTPSSESYSTLGTTTKQSLETSSIIKDISALNSSQFEYTDMRSTEPSIKRNVSTTLPYSSHNVSSDDPIKLTTPLPDSSTIPNRIPPSSTLAVSGTYSSTPSSESYNTLGTSTQHTLETSSIIKDTSALNSSQFEYTDMRSTEPSIKQNVSTTLPYSSHNVSSDDPIKLTTPLPDSSTIPNRIPPSSTLAVSGTYSSTPSSESYSTLGTTTKQSRETSSIIKDTSGLNSSQFEYTDMRSTEPSIKQKISTTLPYSSHNVSSYDPIKPTTPLPDTSTIPNRIPPSSTLAVSGTYSSTPSSESYNTLGTSTQQTLETSSIIKDTSALNSSQFEYTDMRSTEPSIKQKISTTLPYSSHNVSSYDPIKPTTPLPDTSTIPNRIPPSSTLAVSGTYSSTPSSESYNTLGTSTQQTLETSSIIKDTSALNSSQFEYTDMRSTEPSIKQNVSTTLPYSSHKVSSSDSMKLTTPLPDTPTIPNRIPPSSSLAVSSTYSTTPSSESYNTLGTSTQQSRETSSIIKDTSGLNSSQFEYTDMRSTEPSIKQNVSTTLPYSSHYVISYSNANSSQETTGFPLISSNSDNFTATAGGFPSYLEMNRSFHTTNTDTSKFPNQVTFSSTPHSSNGNFESSAITLKVEDNNVPVWNGSDSNDNSNSSILFSISTPTSTIPEDEIATSASSMTTNIADGLLNILLDNLSGFFF